MKGQGSDTFEGCYSETGSSCIHFPITSLALATQKQQEDCMCVRMRVCVSINEGNAVIDKLEGN